MKVSTIYLLLLLVAPVYAGSYVKPTLAKKEAAHAVETDKKVALFRALDRLWADHVFWTREFIIAAVADRPKAEVDAIAARLMKNQEDIGAAIAGYYGKAAGNQLTQLLKEHIAIAVDIVTAAKGGNKGKQKAATEKWFTNADDIAKFLAQVNPKSWPHAAMKSMLEEHLKLTAKELELRLGGKDWEQDIANFDKIFTQALGMSKGLADGIISAKF